MSLTWGPLALVWILPISLLSGERSLPDASQERPVVIHDQNLEFVLELPAGFASAPAILQSNPRFYQAYVLGDLVDEVPDIVLVIERLGGTLGAPSPGQMSLPPGIDGRVYSLTWNGLPIQAVEIREETNEIKIVTHNVQIPLRGEAIQLKLVGTAERAGEVASMIAGIVSRLRGESNWVVEGGSIQARRGLGRTGFLVLTGVIVLGGLAIMLVFSRWAPRGSILALSFLIWSSSFGFESKRRREDFLITGSVRTLGSAGMILGVIDLVRKRKPKAETQPTLPQPKPPERA